MIDTELRFKRHVHHISVYGGDNVVATHAECWQSEAEEESTFSISGDFSAHIALLYYHCISPNDIGVPEEDSSNTPT